MPARPTGTSFIGRRGELATLRGLLSSARMLTLVGTGGVGKTRLAQELARRKRTGVVVWLDLAPLREGSAIAPAAERALGIPAGASIDTANVDAALRGERALIVLDNCEHLLPAVRTVANRLLTSNARVTVLATSRAPLGIDSEQLWRVPPLSVPATELESPSRAMAADAVRLFVDRAGLAQPGFDFTSACTDVVAICRALEGIPLAIELAAARTRHMSVASIRARLEHPLAILADERHPVERHRTLETTIEWSHGLLTDAERTLFRRLAVFSGGFSLAAAEAVYGHDASGEPPFSGVTVLVDRSLVEYSPARDRYRMLEPIREFAQDRLREKGELALATERCAEFLVNLATVELAADVVAKADARIRDEFGNVAAVLPWLIDHDPGAAVRTLCRYSRAMWTAIPVHLSIVSQWLSRALDAYPEHDALRATGLIYRARLDRMVSDDEVRTARSRAAVDEALSIAVELGDAGLELLARTNSASVAVSEGPPERAIALYDAVAPRLPPRDLAMALSVRAVLKVMAHDAAGADADLAEAFATWDAIGEPSNGERFLTRLSAADVAYRCGHPGLASTHMREAILGLRRAGEEQGPAPFEFLAHLAADAGDDERASRLAGFADRLRTETGRWPSAFYALTDRSWLPRTERALGSRAYRVRAQGRRMSIDEAIVYAVQGRDVATLTSRESAIARLVAEGLGDKEIAARLGISERTAENHVQHVRAKLGLRSRAQIGRWVSDREHDLVG